MKYIFGSISLFLVKYFFFFKINLIFNFFFFFFFFFSRRHFGLHIFAAFTVLYYIGITLLSALWIDTERLLFLLSLKKYQFFLKLSDNDKRLWLLGIFCIVLIDAFLDLSLIFLLHLLKIPSNSYLWKFLSLNGFTNSVRSVKKTPPL